MRFIRDREKNGIRGSGFFSLSWCFTSTETMRFIRDRVEKWDTEEMRGQAGHLMS